MPEHWSSPHRYAVRFAWTQQSLPSFTNWRRRHASMAVAFRIGLVAHGLAVAPKEWPSVGAGGVVPAQSAICCSMTA